VGLAVVNDIRRLENMDPIGTEGDVYLQPTNMAPAGTPVPDSADGDANPQDPDDVQEDKDAR
jgi:hypothetical protein